MSTKLLQFNSLKIVASHQMIQTHICDQRTVVQLQNLQPWQPQNMNTQEILIINIRFFIFEGKGRKNIFFTSCWVWAWLKEKWFRVKNETSLDLLCMSCRLPWEGEFYSSSSQLRILFRSLCLVSHIYSYVPGDFHLHRLTCRDVWLHHQWWVHSETETETPDMDSELRAELCCGQWSGHTPPDPFSPDDDMSEPVPG